MSLSRGSSVVLVDEAAEPVVSLDLAFGWWRGFISVWRSKAERAVRPLAVVVGDVGVSTCSRWRRLRISSQSKHSERTVRTKRSAIAFAFGARTGVFTIRMPSLRKTSSKWPLYLLSGSRIRKRTPWSE
jgi:hypothetical protein